MLKGVNLSMGILNDYLELTSMSEIVQDLSLVNKQKTVLTALATVIDQYSQVSFLPCSVYKKDLINYLVHTLEGIFGTREKNYF